MFNIDKTIKKIISKKPVFRKNMFGKKLNFPSMSAKPSKRDWDGDGILNWKDCQPRNIMRQDAAPNTLMKERIDALPIYHTRHRASIPTKYGGGILGSLITAGEHPKDAVRDEFMVPISSSQFPKKQKQHIYGTMKQHPHLISEIEQRKSNIIFAHDSQKPTDGSFTERRLQGASVPITKGATNPEEHRKKKITGASTFVFSPNKYDNQSKDRTAQIIFHELKHSEQNLGLTGEQYHTKKGYSNTNYKEYVENPDEREARQQQYAKMS